MDKNFYLNENSLITRTCPHIILNLGNNKPVKLMRFIHLLEENLGLEAIKEFEPMQMGDVTDTFADISLIYEWIKFKPKIPIEEGVKKFINWFKAYYLEI